MKQEVCSWIEPFKQKDLFPKIPNSDRDFFQFIDGIFLMTKKKDQFSINQLDCIKNIKILGCQHHTFWCFTKGYKECGFKNNDKNILHNYSVMFKYALEHQFNSTLIIEDDLVIVNDVWKNYDQRQKEVIQLMTRFQKEPLIFHFGFYPLIYNQISQHIGAGYVMNAHCVMYNRIAMIKFLSLYDSLMASSSRWKMADTYYWSYYFQKYLLLPNDLFFQKSSTSSTQGTLVTTNKGLNLVYEIQALVTGRKYYQYDPRFVSFWEPITRNMGLFIICLILLLVIFYHQLKKYLSRFLL